MTPVRDRVVSRFRELYGRPPEVLARSPGRINLLGGHVDYNEGWVLPGAIDRAIWVAASRANEPYLEASSLELGDASPVPLRPPPGPAASEDRAPAGWIEYPAGVAWALHRAGHAVAPLRAVIGSELPAGAGLSSSAALEVAFLLVWRELGDLTIDDLDAALLCRQVENEYVGVQSGLMDPFACLHGRRDHVVLLDCRSLDWERLALPAGAALLVADSGVRRRLADGPLNDRRAECLAALYELRRRFPDRGLTALRDVDRATLDDAAQEMAPLLARRVRHVVEECERVRRGASMLRECSGSGVVARASGPAPGATATVGALMRDSHRSSRDLYEASIPELDALAEAAWAAPGCHGARLVGAGFGGCVTALVDASSAPAVAAAIERDFSARFGRAALLYACSLGDGATVA